MQQRVPTITTDYPPMNSYVTQPELRVRKQWFKRSAFPARAAGIRHAHLRLPSERDLARKMTWCAEHDLGPISRDNRRRMEQLFAPDAVREEWARVLGAGPAVAS